MPSFALPQQLINGINFDYTSILIVLRTATGLIPHGGVKSIEYSHTLEPGHGRGTRAQVALRSRGKYDAKASMEIYKSEYQQIIADLAGSPGNGVPGVRGYMEQSFDVLVAYAQNGLPTVTDIVGQCRIKSDSDSINEDGGLALVKVELDVLSLIRDQLVPVELARFLR